MCKAAEAAAAAAAAVAAAVAAVAGAVMCACDRYSTVECSTARYSARNTAAQYSTAHGAERCYAARFELSSSQSTCVTKESQSGALLQIIAHTADGRTA